ncbi:MAG: hypothetical protein ACRC2T_08110, partial [Thermoguttaceae bacterium]
SSQDDSLCGVDWNIFCKRFNDNYDRLENGEYARFDKNICLNNGWLYYLSKYYRSKQDADFFCLLLAKYASQSINEIKKFREKSDGVAKFINQ